MNKAQIAIQAARLRHTMTPKQQAQIAINTGNPLPDPREGKEIDMRFLCIMGVPNGLYRLACQLESMRKAGAL